ncbi:MAG: DUF5640 domain-containing protein [Clostridia bacterium]|nr:DUF5640 domain-containing protein [Clostridia bacterium]
MKRTICILTALLLVPLLAACGGESNTDGTTLRGTWYEEDAAGVLTFGETDGTSEENAYLAAHSSFTYETEDGTLRFTNAEGETVETTYELKAETLIVTVGGETHTYLRDLTYVAPGTADPVETPSESPTEQPTEPPTETMNLIDYLIGTWEAPYDGETLVYTFNADGTGTLVNSAFPIVIPMTFSIEGDVITVVTTAFGNTDTGSATFDAASDVLILTNGDGETLVMTRVE